MEILLFILVLLFTLFKTIYTVRFTLPKDIANDDLSLPDWARFIQLFRQLLDAPLDMAKTPLIIRDVAFSCLMGSVDRTFVKGLCIASPQAGRFALLTIDYLFKAAKLPHEFLKKSEEVLIPLLAK
jgi:hypothetical protein